jgi:hypothetical protein
VDIDRYIARNEPTWLRLDELTTRARRSVGSLSPAEIEELVQLYQRTSAQLSYTRTYLRDPTLVSRLTRLVASATGVLYGKRTKSWRAVGRFFADTFPGAVYHCRHAVLVATALFFVPAILLGAWITTNPSALDATAPRKVREHYVHDLFEQYYRPTGLVFFAQVTTNNIRSASWPTGSGRERGLGGVPPRAQGAPLGIISSWMIAEGDFGRFLGFIIPTALELSAICIAVVPVCTWVGR